jgi:hypothetical protein
VPYAGLLVLALAALAMLRPQLRITVFFGMLAIAALALALRTPLLDALALLLPPYRQFEDHTRWFVIWGFAAAVLAGLGAEALRSRSRLQPRPWWLWLSRGLAATIGVLVGGWALWHLQLFTPQSRYGEYITLVYRQPLAPAMWLGLTSLGALVLLAGTARLAGRAGRAGRRLVVERWCAPQRRRGTARHADRRSARGAGRAGRRRGRGVAAAGDPAGRCFAASAGAIPHPRW